MGSPRGRRSTPPGATSGRSTGGADGGPGPFPAPVSLGRKKNISDGRTAGRTASDTGRPDRGAGGGGDEPPPTAVPQRGHWGGLGWSGALVGAIGGSVGAIRPGGWSGQSGRGRLRPALAQAGRARWVGDRAGVPPVRGPSSEALPDESRFSGEEGCPSTAASFPPRQTCSLPANPAETPVFPVFPRLSPSYVLQTAVTRSISVRFT